MGNPVYLTQSRHAVWYFRWPLPKSLHPQGRPSDIKVSLATRDRREALRLARSLGDLGETLTAQGIAQGMRYEDLRATLTKHFAQKLADKKAQIAEHGRLDPLTLAALRNSEAAAQQALETGETLCLAGEHPWPGSRPCTASASTQPRQRTGRSGTTSCGRSGITAGLRWPMSVLPVDSLIHSPRTFRCACQ